MARRNSRVEGEEMKGLGGNEDMPHAKDGDGTKEFNAWSGPGPAAFDFRSWSLLSSSPPYLPFPCPIADGVSYFQATQ